MAATTVYYTPYKHNYARLYNGTSWQVVQFSEVSQTLADSTKSPAAGAVSSNYDMFLWNDSGTLRCTRGPAWTNVTTRGTGAGTTELEQVDGTLVNKIAITNGPAAQRGLYVGTISTSATGANGQLNMMFFPAAAAGGSANRLDVWNMYNRVTVAASCRDSTDSWDYSTATWRAANAAAASGVANRITVVHGLNEDIVDVTVFHLAKNTNAGVMFRTAVGLDSTSAISGFPGMTVSPNNVAAFGMVGKYGGLLGLGSHFLQWLEYSAATATTTWYGDNNEPLNAQSGIMFVGRM